MRLESSHDSASLAEIRYRPRARPWSREPPCPMTAERRAISAPGSRLLVSEILPTSFPEILAIHSPRLQGAIDANVRETRIDDASLLSGHQELLDLPVRRAIHQRLGAGVPYLEPHARHLHAAALPGVRHLDVADRPDSSQR